MRGLTRNKLFFGEKGDRAVRPEVEEGRGSGGRQEPNKPRNNGNWSHAPSRHSLAASSSQLLIFPMSMSHIKPSLFTNESISA